MGQSTGTDTQGKGQSGAQVVIPPPTVRRFCQGRRSHSTGKEPLLQWMLLGPQDVSVQKQEAGPLPPTIFRRQLRTGQRPASVG